MNLGYGPKEIERADPNNTKGQVLLLTRKTKLAELVAKELAPKIKLTYALSEV